jgi:hypothetical protein
MAPTRTRHLPSPLNVEIAKILDGARVARRPRVDISELARQSGIERSMLSRMLKPEKSMLVDELVAVCTALGLDAGRVIDEARRRVSASDGQAGGARPAPHSTTVTEEDIAAGVGLPRGGPRQRRTRPSIDTERRKHT